ncbi:OTX5-like protein, partial [Mya arenaria]
MIEVDTVRRNFNIGHYDPNYMLPTHPLSGGMAGPHLDHRVLVHWNQTNAGSQQPVSAALKSDEEEDDDDEDRPFTPPPPRERLSYTRYQLELLNGIFLEVRYPNSTQKQLIAKRVGITRDQVKIWFQNRRRKEVIGNSGKAKSSDTSMSSSCSSGIAESHSPAADDNEISSSDENNCFKDSNETVVPSLVMKSIIGELIKFTNDPLKGKKIRKKSRAKQREREKNNKLKKGLATTLLHGAYDMISPPNQVTPTAFFEKMKNGFNHSKNSSAFASPRDNPAKPAQISNISSTSDTQVEQVHSAVLVSSSSRTLPVTSVRGGGYDRPLPQIPTSLMNAGYPLPAYTQYTSSLPNDFP